MPDIQLPEIRLYYEERGDGVPILCIHGTSSSAMVWEGSTTGLESLGRVIVYDRRGCTRSERPEPYVVTSVSEHADDAAALLKALSARPAIIVGRSYGGEVAIDMALRYPDRVRALVLLEGALLALTPSGQLWTDTMTERILSAADEAMDGVAEVLLRAAVGDHTWEHFPGEVQQMFIDNSPAIVAEFRGGLLDVDTSKLSTVRHPTLLVAATESDEAFRDATAVMAASMPNASTELVGGGHMVNPSDPAVLEFIRGVIAGSESAVVAN